MTVADSIQIVKLKREISRLKRLLKERSIDEAQLLEKIQESKTTRSSMSHFLEAILNQTQKEKASLEEQLQPKIRELDDILAKELTKRQFDNEEKPHYQSDRLFIEDIDNFANVREVSPAEVQSFLKNGFLDISEEDVQISLEAILDVPFHKKDWGGEFNDLYTSNVLVAGQRRASAFLLKGPGIGKKEMSIADCGKRGDQIVRLFETPANLFVVQYVGPIAEAIITDVQSKIDALPRKKRANFLIMDGQDTARVLYAYGKL